MYKILFDWLDLYIPMEVFPYNILSYKMELKISYRLRIMCYPITNESYYLILKSIADFLDCYLLTRKQIKTCNVYYIIAASSKI